MTSYRRSGDLLRRCALAGLMALSLSAIGFAPAHAAGPGRIAVTGAFPGGYVGLLARYGLPHDIILDYQLNDAAVLSRYDLLIVAGPPRVPVSTLLSSLRNGAPTPLQQFVAKGGDLLIDYGTGNATTWDMLLGRGTRFPGGASGASSGAAARVVVREFPGNAAPAAAMTPLPPGAIPPFPGTPAPAALPAAAAGAAVVVPPFPGGPPQPAVDRRRGGPRGSSAFQLTAGVDNPLRRVLGGQDSFNGAPSGRGGAGVPDVANMEKPQILARYVGGFSSPFSVVSAQPGSPAADLGAPAIVLETLGKGRIVHCGPRLAIETGLASADYDGLILAMVRLATNGRAVPQLEPEGPHLGRLQTAGAVKLQNDSSGIATEAPAAPPVASRPAGVGQRGALPAGFTSVEEDPTTEFNLSGRPGAGGAQVLLNYWSKSDFVRVGLSGAGVRVERVLGTKTHLLASSSVPAGSFLIKERAERLTVAVGSHLVSAGLKGVHAGQVGTRGLEGEAHYQPVEAPYFSDDFMRTSAQDGGWETKGGQWSTAPVDNPDMGANPFSYKVTAKGTADALTGYPFWDEYRFAASVRPDAAGGSIGLGFYAQDARNMLLLRAPVKAGGSIALVRLDNGKERVLAKKLGHLEPGQWYRFAVRVQGSLIQTSIDGVPALSAHDATFTGGRIVLHAEDTQARFDDVLVQPGDAVQPSGAQRLAGQVPSYAGVIDVDSWAGPAIPWEADPETAGLFWRRGTFFGDVGISCALPILPKGARITLVVGADGVSAGSGCAANLARTSTGARLELRRGGKLLAAKNVAAGMLQSLGLRLEGKRLVALLNGRPLLSANGVTALAGHRVAVQAAGIRPRISTITLTSGNVRDYTFDAAPVDWWVGSGEWDVTNRWSCTPDWSWFGGYSKDVASIWYKRPLEGDVTVDFYVGPKMLQPSDLQTGPGGDLAIENVGRLGVERLADFDAVLCGDGVNVRSGYSFIVGENGTGAAILRNGVRVAECKEFQFFTQAHNRWGNIRVCKEGARVALYVEGQEVLEYRDPHPLTGGYAGIWTQNNGIMLPRITLFYAGAGRQLLSLR